MQNLCSALVIMQRWKGIGCGVQGLLPVRKPEQLWAAWPEDSHNVVESGCQLHPGHPTQCRPDRSKMVEQRIHLSHELNGLTRQSIFWRTAKKTLYVALLGCVFVNGYLINKFLMAVVINAVALHIQQKVRRPSPA